jgi:DNA invertase Pin-like site-specific DNA recombinase
LFQMMGVFAEFERAMIRDRVKAGLANARAKNVRTVHRVLNGEHVSQAAPHRA